LAYSGLWQFLGAKREMFRHKVEIFAAISVLAIHLLASASFVCFSEQSKQTITQAIPISVSLVTPTKVEPIKPPEKQKQPIKQVKNKEIPVVAAISSASTESVVAPIIKKQIDEKPVEQAAITLPNYNANYLHNPQPKYPIASRKMSEEGKVILRVFVGVDGTVQKIELKNSSGFARLDQSAMETVKEWKFVPAKKGEETIASWVNVPITFKLGA